MNDLANFRMGPLPPPDPEKVQERIISALKEYEREMEEAVPAIVVDVKNRQRLADEARQRRM